MNANKTWEQLWILLEPEERQQAIDSFWDVANTRPDLHSLREHLLTTLARALNFRPQTLRAKDCRWVAAQLVRQRVRQFDPDIWSLLFTGFYANHRSMMTCAFLDRLGMEHDENGMVDGHPDVPDVSALENAARSLLPMHSEAQVSHYLAVLDCLDLPLWANAGEAWTRLQDAAQPAATATRAAGAAVAQPDAAEPDAQEPAADAEPNRGIPDGFTTLDHVLTGQIIASVTGVEGALDGDQLDDLVTTVIDLNATRSCSHFHLGYLETLTPGSEPRFQRSTSNSEHRAWYLTGVLAARVRQGNTDAFRQALAACSSDFHHAARQPDGAGTVMASLLLDTLFDTRCDREALTLLRGQLVPTAFELAGRAYQHATDLLRQGDIDAALPLLELLRERIDACNADAGDRNTLSTRIERRYGQCLQRRGDLGHAHTVLSALTDRAPRPLCAELCADLGLIASGFRSLGYIRLPAGDEERASLQAALDRGEDWYRRAIGHGGHGATSAHIALAMRDYLIFADHDDGRQVEAHQTALQHARKALIGMRESGSFGVYEQIGVFGQLSFIEIVLEMDSLTVGDSHAVLSRWRRIPADSGHFPPQDLRRLIDCAVLLNPEIAIKIADSIWERRGSEAWPILGGASVALIKRSSYLRQQLLAEARCEDNPRQRRIALWHQLIPVQLASGDKDLAIEGLDTLESLVQEPQQAQQFHAWLADPTHYDPAWSAAEAAWARIRLARTIGEDTACTSALIDLFYQQRDQCVEAAGEIAQLLIDWQLDSDQGKVLLSSLPSENTVDDSLDVDQRLAAGAPVSVLFVGGNETQARYDDRIIRELLGQWPGIEVRFEHTGWSSNWGRDVDRLVRDGNAADAVVLMHMIRTKLGRTLRERLASPWIACTGTGRETLLRSLRQALRVGLRQQLRAAA